MGGKKCVKGGEVLSAEGDGSREWIRGSRVDRDIERRGDKGVAGTSCGKDNI
jgi:hypothetical protein